MDRAKAAAAEFLGKSGHKDTTVHETVNPAVVSETVKPTQHEEVQTVVDREVHQDHYHTSVQPVQDRQILPEQHSHRVDAVTEQKFDHGSSAVPVDAQPKFRDERVVAPTAHTHATAQTVQGEHVHHHVHETIQPVVQRETIQPQVVHTVQPVHEVHRNEPTVHSSTQLPAMTIEEMKAKGLPLDGRGERYDHFEGEPKLATGSAPRMADSTSTSTSTTAPTATTGSTSATTTSGSKDTGLYGTSSNPVGSSNVSPPGYGGSSSTTNGSATATSTSTSNGSKSSLMDKLNPKVDSTGDGQAGFMK